MRDKKTPKLPRYELYTPTFLQMICEDLGIDPFDQESIDTLVVHLQQQLCANVQIPRRFLGFRDLSTWLDTSDFSSDVETTAAQASHGDEKEQG